MSICLHQRMSECFGACSRRQQPEKKCGTLVLSVRLSSAACVSAQPATAGMLPPSSDDEDDSSEEESEEEEKPKARTPQPAVVSARPCAPVNAVSLRHA